MMTTHILLAQVGTVNRVTVPGHTQPIAVWKLDTAQLSGLYQTELPPDIWVVESQPGEMFFHRFIVGTTRIQIAQELMRCMIHGIADELREIDPVAQWVPLKGGLYFLAWPAMAEVFPQHWVLPLQTCYLEVGRSEVPRGSRNWVAKVWNSHKGYHFADDIIIGEGAMASGSTGEALVHFIVKQAKRFRKQPPKRIWLFVAAGSYQGIARMYQACQQYGIDLKVILAQALFNVFEEAGPSSGKTMTDLCLLTPGTLASQAVHDQALVEWQGKEGCVVGDVGNAFAHTAQYTDDTMRELLCQLDLDLDRVNPEWCSVDLRAMLADCSFLREPLPDLKARALERLVLAQREAVKRALIQHQCRVELPWSK